MTIESDNEDLSDKSDIEDMIARRYQMTRLGRISKSCDYKRNFPGTAHMSVGKDNRRWLQPYYFNDFCINEKLGSGIYYKDSYFEENTKIEELRNPRVDVEIKG